MTAYTATFSAAVNVFGGAPTDKWQAYNWNAFLWGQGTNTVPRVFTHLLTASTYSAAATFDFRLTGLLSAQSQPSTAAIGVRLILKLNGESIGQSDAMVHEYVQDPNGYYRVFPEGVTDHVLSTTPNWTAGSSQTVTWAASSPATTTWS